jgi:hypothetical protein
MYVRTSRYSFKDDGATKVGAEVFNDIAIPLWTGQPGFVSVSRYQITMGQYKGQQMVVLRFKDKASMDIARGSIKDQRDTMLRHLEKAGVTLEESMELEELA